MSRASGRHLDVHRAGVDGCAVAVVGPHLRRFSTRRLRHGVWFLWRLKEVVREIPRRRGDALIGGDVHEDGNDEALAKR